MRLPHTPSRPEIVAQRPSVESKFPTVADETAIGRERPKNPAGGGSILQR